MSGSEGVDGGVSSMEEPVTPSCCAPSVASEVGIPRRRPHDQTSPPRSRSTKGQVLVSGGQFSMGDHFDEGYAADGELPVHPVEVAPFHLDETAVSVTQFAAFVRATGYVTEAEEWGVSAVFHAHLAAPSRDVVNHVAEAPWWLAVEGASWRFPGGGKVRSQPNHPATHITWKDAQEYAEWAGKRLPTEAEWEFASRGGLTGRRFPWGDELVAKGSWRCNIFQGEFPQRNSAEDGYESTAPVKSYRPNGYGLWNMVGNVWEWCADWFSPAYYSVSPRENPQGPDHGERRVMRGGSFLCHDSYCHRYRVAARSSNDPHSTSSNVGFRCANDA